jgi:hypothetical protein
VGAKKGQKVRYCTGQEYLLAMHKKMDSDEQKSKGRRARVQA